MRFRFSVKKFAVASTLLAALACSPVDSPMGPTAKPEAGLIGGLLGGVTGLVGNTLNTVLGILLPCSPQPSVKVSQRVGSSGGTIYFGRHSLVIPRGALSKTVTITAETFPAAGNAVGFKPEGLQFATPATLRLNYGNCQDKPRQAKAVVYTDDELNIVERLESLDDRRSQKVQADLHHFSRYAVAW